GTPGSSGRSVSRRVSNGELETVEYMLKRHRTSKCARLRVKNSGVTVTAPPRMPLSVIDDFVKESFDWIRNEQKRIAFEADQLRVPAFEPVEGGRMLFRGDVAVLRLGAVQSCARKCLDGSCEIRLAVPSDADAAAVTAALSGFLKSEARSVIAEIFEDVRRSARCQPVRWQLSGAKTRWGVCTAAKTVRWSWRLIFVSDELVRYVVAHELAHLVELNHSDRFWREVERLDPSWQDHRRRLKRYQAALLPPVN
ncbi:MAG: M48 family metallopeptidase, partial [Sutterella sp.]